MEPSTPHARGPSNPPHRKARLALLGAGLLLASAVVGGVVAAAPPTAHAQVNGAAATPQAGWSSWSFIRYNPTESNIEAQAAAMSSSGLVSHGYTYVNIDDFYYLAGSSGQRNGLVEST